MSSVEESHDLKTLDNVFLREMQVDFGFTPVVSRAVLERAKSTFKSGIFDSKTVNVGQMRILRVYDYDFPDSELSISLFFTPSLTFSTTLISEITVSG